MKQPLSKCQRRTFVRARENDSGRPGAGAGRVRVGGQKGTLLLALTGPPHVRVNMSPNMDVRRPSAAQYFYFRYVMSDKADKGPIRSCKPSSSGCGFS